MGEGMCFIDTGMWEEVMRGGNMNCDTPTYMDVAWSARCRIGSVQPRRL